MSETDPKRKTMAKFSLRHLLTFTAIIAVGIAFGMAYRKNQSLYQHRNELHKLSSYVPIHASDRLQAVPMPGMAAHFQSWQVNVPEGKDYVVRLGLGPISEKAIPPVVNSVRLPAGLHRVTLRREDTVEGKFLFAVFVDGVQVMEEVMGSDWIPGGWSSSGSISWPSRPSGEPDTLQLESRYYQPKIKLGQNHYFNSDTDNYVTRSGFRLWIDQPENTYRTASPFMGFPNDPRYMGVGLRDGIRLNSSRTSAYQWAFTRPKLATSAPILQMEAEFVADDGAVLSSQYPTFQAWKMGNSALKADTLQWQDDPSQTTHTVFLHATSTSNNVSPNTDLNPVVEIKWDENRPDEVGMRLADTPSNDRISRWRLRILDGSHHLWREFYMGEQPSISPNDATNLGKAEEGSSNEQTKRKIVLDLDPGTEADIHLKWQTNEKLPLQIVQRSQSAYSNWKLYQGLPVTLVMQIPVTLQPTLTVDVLEKDPSSIEKTFPGGPVFDEIQIDLEATKRDWIWIGAKQKK